MNQVANFRSIPTTKLLVNGLFDELFHRNIGDVLGSDVVAQRPAVNISETKNSFNLQVAAPGFDKGDFELKVENNLLTISAKREQASENTEERFTRREFRYESFKRSFNLPDSVNQNDVAAVYENGILHVSLPKKEEAIPVTKAISVN
jgi:HSP20 family protein